ARSEAERLVSEATVEGNSLVEKARTDADELLAGTRRDAAQIRARAEELRDRITGEIEELHERARREAAETMKSTGDRCDALIKAAEEQLAKAEAKAKEIVSERSEEHTSELQSRENLVCRLLLEKNERNNIWTD